jgi:vacuolar-type H+-ATPase subunit F/Vma7
MSETHLYFLGEAALANGFRLAGFTVFAGATEEQLDDLLQGLVENRERAFVVLDESLYDADLPILHQLRGEGGRILLSQVPPLHDPSAMRSPVDSRIAQLLGGGV